jgi:hypothetical protein
VLNSPPPGQYRVRLGGFAGAKDDMVKRDINLLMGGKFWRALFIRVLLAILLILSFGGLSKGVPPIMI